MSIYDTCSGNIWVNDFIVIASFVILGSIIRWIEKKWSARNSVVNEMSIEDYEKVLKDAGFPNPTIFLTKKSKERIAWEANMKAFDEYPRSPGYGHRAPPSPWYGPLDGDGIDKRIPSTTGPVSGVTLPKPGPRSRYPEE